MKRALLGILLSLCTVASYAQTAPGVPTSKTVEFLYQQIIAAEAAPSPNWTALSSKFQSADVMAEVRSKALSGNAHAQDVLAACHLNGWGGLKQDYAQAASCYRKAADQGLADAQYNLGVSYANGQGVPRDYAEAASWYTKAADQGDAAAQFSLGIQYENGFGVPKDYAEAAVWYRKAAGQGNVNARLSLQLLKLSGKLLLPATPNQTNGPDANDVSRNFTLIKAPPGYIINNLTIGETNIYGILFGAKYDNEIFKLDNENEFNIINNIYPIPQGSPNPYLPSHAPTTLTIFDMPSLFYSKSRGVYGCVRVGQPPFTFGMLFRLKDGQFSQILSGDEQSQIGCSNVVSDGDYLYFPSRDLLQQSTINSFTTIPNRWNAERTLTVPQKGFDLTPIATDSSGGLIYEVDNLGATIYYLKPGDKGIQEPKILYKPKADNEAVFAKFLLGQLYIIHQPYATYGKPEITTISRVNPEGKVIDIATAPVSFDKIELVASGGTIYGACSTTHQYGQLFKIEGNTIKVIYNFSPDSGWYPASLISVGDGVCGTVSAGLGGFGGVFCYDHGDFQQIAAFPKDIGPTFIKRIDGSFNGKIVGTATSILKKESYIFEIPLHKISDSTDATH